MSAVGAGFRYSNACHCWYGLADCRFTVLPSFGSTTPWGVFQDIALWTVGARSIAGGVAAGVALLSLIPGPGGAGGPGGDSKPGGGGTGGAGGTLGSDIGADGWIQSLNEKGASERHQTSRPPPHLCGSAAAGPAPAAASCAEPPRRAETRATR
jgi:hypothetical protein